MTKSRIYKDIDMNFEPHPATGDISKKFDENDIKQSVSNLIRTDFYSRLDENIGVDVKRSLFALNNFVTKSHLESVVEDILEYEPRITVISVIVNITEQNKYKIRVDFIIKNSNQSTITQFLEI